MLFTAEWGQTELKGSGAWRCPLLGTLPAASTGLGSAPLCPEQCESHGALTWGRAGTLKTSGPSETVEPHQAVNQVCIFFFKFSLIYIILPAVPMAEC